VSDRAGEKSYKIAGREEARIRVQLVREPSLPRAIQLVSRSSKKSEKPTTTAETFLALLIVKSV
jgi:hypothetical protein